MELIGSKTESDFREELLRSNEALQDLGSRLRQALMAEGHDIQNAYVISMIPEQLEDLFTVLVDGSYLVDVEIDKFDTSIPPVIERKELEFYCHGLSKINQIRLAVAQELARNQASKG